MHAQHWYRLPELLQHQDVEWEEAYPDVTLPPIQLTVVPLASEGDVPCTNFIKAAEKELEAKLLPSSGGGESDKDVELMKDDSIVALVDGPEDGDAGGEEGNEL